MFKLFKLENVINQVVIHLENNTVKPGLIYKLTWLFCCHSHKIQVNRMCITSSEMNSSSSFSSASVKFHMWILSCAIAGS